MRTTRTIATAIAGAAAAVLLAAGTAPVNLAEYHDMKQPRTGVVNLAEYHDLGTDDFYDMRIPR